MRPIVPVVLAVVLVAAGCAPAPAPTVLAPSAAARAGEPPASAPVAAGRPLGTPSAAGTPAPAPAGTAAPAPSTPPAPAQTASPMVPPTPTRSAVPDSDPPAEPATLPSASPAAAPSVRPADRASLTLARTADFVRQYTFEWCVGASIQMTRSIVTGDREESRASQRRYWEMARDRTIGSPYGGANPAGWAAALNDLGLGTYRLVSVPTFDKALRRAARALAETGRPVGLVMWAGRHAWVMTGYEATGDPVTDADARVARVRVMDPLYPHGSRWGPSPAPNRLVGRKALARQFVMRDRPDYDFGVEPGWLLVLPVS